jgi:geranylgeranyl pyrophosphate synthase
MSVQSRLNWQKGNKFNEYLEETTSAYLSYIGELINEEEARASSLGLKNDAFEDMVQIALSCERGNPKQLRPTLVRLGYDLFRKSNNDWRWILPVCTAVAFKDNAYYVFDSNLDENDTKRGIFGSITLAIASWIAD